MLCTILKDIKLTLLFFFLQFLLILLGQGYKSGVVIEGEKIFVT